MTKEPFFDAKLFKFMFPIFMAACIIKIFEGGYHFGQWLYAVLR